MTKERKGQERKKFNNWAFVHPMQTERKGRWLDAKEKKKGIGKRKKGIDLSRGKSFKSNS